MKPLRFDRYAGFLERRGAILLAMLGLCILGGLWGIFRIQVETDFSVFMPRDSAAIDNLERMQQLFGDQSQMICMVTLTEPVRTVDTVRRLLDLEDRLSATEGVRQVRGPIPRRAVLDGRLVDVGTVTAEQIPELLDRLGEMGLLGAFSESSRHAAYQILLQSASAGRDFLKDLGRTVEDAGWEYVFSGQPFLEASVFDYVLRILYTLPPSAIVLVLLVFRWRIGSMKATGLCMFPAVVTALLTLGGIGWILGRVSLITAIVPLFIIVMGSADGLHFTAHVLDELDRGSSRREAVRSTLEAVGMPMALTTVTTSAGFLSMLFIRSEAIKTMGLCASAGILGAGCVTWFFLPVLLLHVPSLARPHPRGIDRISDVVQRLRGRPAVLLSVGICAASLPGVFLVRADFNMLSLYKPRTEVRRSIDAVNAALGGAIPVWLLYTADGDLFAPEIASTILEFEDELRRAGMAGRTVSIYDVIVGAQSTYPDNARSARILAAMIDRMQPGVIETFYNSEARSGRVMLLLRDLNDRTLGALMAIASRYSERIELIPIGIPLVLKEMNDQIIPQQLTSLIFACALVFLIIAVAQRSLRVGAATILPISVTLLAMFGVMGYARINLSIITGIMSGLTIGVGIDYAIHYASLFRHFRRRGDTQAAEAALRYVSSPVLANALGLAIGFSAMLLSPLRIHTYLAILMWVTMLCSGLLSLTLLPTVLRDPVK